MARVRGHSYYQLDIAPPPPTTTTTGSKYLHLSKVPWKTGPQTRKRGTFNPDNTNPSPGQGMGKYQVPIPGAKSAGSDYAITDPCSCLRRLWCSQTDTISGTAAGAHSPIIDTTESSAGNYVQGTQPTLEYMHTCITKPTSVPSRPVSSWSRAEFPPQCSSRGHRIGASPNQAAKYSMGRYYQDQGSPQQFLSRFPQLPTCSVIER